MLFLATDEAGDVVLAVSNAENAGDEAGHAVLAADEAGGAVLSVDSLGDHVKHFVGHQIS